MSAIEQSRINVPVPRVSDGEFDESSAGIGGPYESCEEPDPVCLEDLNNFFTRLPGGAYWRALKEGNRILNSPLTQVSLISKEIQYRGNGASLEKALRGFTLKRMNQTTQEFYRDIERGVSHCKVENEKLIEVIERLNNAHDQIVRNQIKQELFELILPIYKYLRSEGYSHQDLCA
ncbi:MAG: hypothetical protein GYA55_11925 [SAR324 cluster bacterium]|uniref:Uncharacterized protein n=1 Tax=SAR324 cluster bacterium TaxID=2024889 RepID=A0A7X9FTG6_9DELT|nr:hypothetical protein [SAR324 cluster bacterium]